ncbi:hypothetical protein HOD96_03300 [Candidatus Falkowbacteria bacterium]|jgi:hypothetical protein|nr:hypothetical protein [Candidatus Falkowbacteria bacterium]MBT4432956.1 hypothetical protein [Candidatus Falkowbacteria bacterium]
MFLIFKNITKAINKKPLLQKVARGFLVLVILIFVWWIFGLEFKDQTVIKIKNNTHLSSWEKAKIFFYKPFYNKASVIPVKTGIQKNITINNINLKDLLLAYENLTKNSFVSILGLDSLTNNFSKEQEEGILEILNGQASVVINTKDGNYYGKIKLANTKNIETKLNNFEKAITRSLAILSPESKKVILPDSTYIYELVMNQEKFSFEDKEIDNKNARYIKEDSFNFEFIYYIEDDTIFFSNLFDELIQEDNNKEESFVTIPMKFLDNFDFVQEILGENKEKYNIVVLTENKKLKETVLIFR